MNYEELVYSGDNAITRRLRIPIGILCRRMSDGGLVNVIELRDDIKDDLFFRDGLRKECAANLGLTGKHQIHFVPAEEADDCLEVERGSYVSVEQLLHDRPAAVAAPGFVSNIVGGLLDCVEWLHSKGVLHVCFAPSNVFVRTGDNNVMLLSHGSYYLNMREPALLYDGLTDYVAPEVLSRGTVDERCDVYSLGKFLEYLFAASEMPYEYRKVVAKAIEIIPEDRYRTVDEMRRAVNLRRGVKHSLRVTMAVLLVSLLCVGAYFELMPEPEVVEYVAPAPRQPEENLFDDGFDPTTELGAGGRDSLRPLTDEERKAMEGYEVKCEKMFRKLYTKEADRILSKIYNKEHMGSNEKKFVAGSRPVLNELMEAQAEVAAKANLGAVRSQEIAAEIIEKLTEEKKKALPSYGIQK